MKVITRDINKYPNREKDFLNFALLPWYEQRLEYIKKTGDDERIAKYNGLDPARMVIEYPTAVFRSKGHFCSTVLARKNGLCFPDANVKFVKFDRFLEHIDPEHKLYKNIDTPAELSKDDLENLAIAMQTFPSSPQYRLTKIKNRSDFAMLISCDEHPTELEQIFGVLFDDYKFEKISGSLIEVSDEGFPKTPQNIIDNYAIGRVAVTDTLLEGMSVNFILFDIKIIKKILTVVNYTYDGNHFYDGDITYSGVVNK